MDDGRGPGRLRMTGVLEEVVWQWGEMRRLVQEAAQQLRRLLASRPWEEELSALRRRVEELERERDVLWHELWELRRRLEEMSGLPLADRLALAREELVALTHELHGLARLAERLDGAGPARRLSPGGQSERSPEA